MKDKIVYVYCPVRKRRAVVRDGLCQYCREAGHKPWTGSAFDIPGWNDDQHRRSRRSR